MYIQFVCLSVASLLDISVDINPVNSQVNQSLRVRLLPIQITYHAVCTCIVVIRPECCGTVCAIGHSGRCHCYVSAVKGRSATKVLYTLCH